MRVAAIVPAAGRGRRMASRIEKPFLRVAGKPLIVHTLGRLSKAYPFLELVVAVSPDRMESARRLLTRFRLGQVRLVAGGRTRAESVRNALRAVRADADWVLVHDAARPLVGRRLVRSLIAEAARSGAALCALPSTATVKLSSADGRRALRTLDRGRIWLAQTPQAFRRDLLEARYRRLGRRALAATDEAALFDGTSVRVGLVRGDERNLKVTTPEDLNWLAHALKGVVR